MFTNRFFNLFVALALVVVAALAIRGAAVKANNPSSANQSYDRIRQIQLEHTHKSATTEQNVITGQAAAQAWLEQSVRLANAEFNVTTAQTTAEAWLEQHK